ncbi:hypothetical protein [Arthrobacter sp. NA-172]|uniref:hypothetical protein n=1 Tax=Arthrobacter sp. NA-172 TaxID=3367524 RepID=UPI003753F9C8
MSELNDLTENTVEPHDARWPGRAAPTGDPAVDAALERLAGVPSLPVAEHGGTYAEIHDSLMAALDADER